MLQRPEGQALAAVFGRIEKSDETQIGIFLKKLCEHLVSDRDPNVRKGCAFCLTRFGQRGVGTLVRALHGDPDRDVRECAAYALGAVGDETVLPELYRAIMDDKDRNGHLGKIGMMSVGSLGRIGGQRAIEYLTVLWRDETIPRDLKVVVLSSVGSAGHPDGLRVIREALPMREDEGMRETATYSLAAIGSANQEDSRVATEVRRLLRELLRDSNPKVRRNAAYGLAWVGEAEDIPRLQSLAATDDYRDVVQRGRHGQLTMDPRYPVREEAKRAVSKIQSRIDLEGKRRR
jgi:HEAT repeat protein